eukprot:2593502-Pleurochrysis_carterae.AAC.5
MNAAHARRSHVNRVWQPARSSGDAAPRPWYAKRSAVPNPNCGQFFFTDDTCDQDATCLSATKCRRWHSHTQVCAYQACRLPMRCARAPGSQPSL